MIKCLIVEDEIAGLQTRIANYTEEEESMQSQIAQKKQSIKFLMSLYP